MLLPILAKFLMQQLNLQMVAGNTFPFYSESKITFMPTYKYNNGTDDYDSSYVFPASLRLVADHDI